MVAQNTAGNPLSAGSLAVFMSASLPKDASPQIRNAYEAVALAVNAGMIAVGFRLVGLGEGHKLETDSDGISHIDHATIENRQLPKSWNTRIRQDGSEDGPKETYAFTYAHPQSSMKYELQVSKFNRKVTVQCEGIGDDRTASFEVVIKDWVSEGNLPYTHSPSEDALRKMQDIFLSAGRLNDLGSLLKVSIIQKVAPGISKEGYEETSATAGSGSSQQRNRSPPARQPERAQRDPLREDPQPAPARPYPFDDPLAIPRPGGNRPLPEPIPGFEDEYEINRPPRGGPLAGRTPFGGLGHNDLYPPGLGPHDGIGGGIGGMGGLRPGGGMGGGMHPTFDDPLFGGGGAGGGYDPQAPPGSRYDPVGPGGAPRDRFGGGRFPGGGGGMGGRPPNPFGGFGDGDFI